MRKIKFQVVVANSFSFPKDNGIDRAHLWPIASADYKEIFPYIEFEPSGGDVMRDAEKALEEYIKNNYPNKEYKIYYWDWLD